MKIENLEEQINNSDPNNLSENDLSVIEFTIQELDKGNIRVVNNKDNAWSLNEWVRDAILLFFSIRNLKEIPRAPTIFLANEFFDAFPIKQFLKKSNNWYEKYVAYKKNKFEVCDQKVSSKIIEKYLGKDIKKEKFVEYSPSAMKFVNEIANFIFKNNGGLLMIDYGFTSGKMKNTLQSVEKHRKISFLENPYNSDITHLINFKMYKKEFANSNLKSLITTQGNFLIKLGILKRAEIISKNLQFSKKADIFYRIKRLIDAKHMGSLFKVLFVSKSKNNFNLGFK